MAAAPFEPASAQHPEAFPVLQALMERTDSEIADLQNLVLAYGNVPEPLPIMAPMEEMLSVYEATIANIRLSDGIKTAPEDLRTQALGIIPGDAIMAASGVDYLPSSSDVTPEAVRASYGSLRLPSIRHTGFTGILGLHTDLQGTYQSLLRTAGGSPEDALDIVLDDDLYAAYIRGHSIPTHVVAREVSVIDTITPRSLMEEHAERTRQLTIARDHLTDPADIAALDESLDVMRRSEDAQRATIMFSNALRHGHARATIARVKQLWSSKGLEHVHGPVMEKLNDVLRTALPMADGSDVVLDGTTVAFFANLRPEDLI